MTEQHILSLPAGRELDLRVGVGIGAFVPAALAWLDDPKMMAYLRDGEECPPPRYSTDVAAALGVVEALRSRRRVVTVKADGLRKPGASAYTVLVDGLPRVDAETAPLAICRAALLVAASPASLP